MGTEDFFLCLSFPFFSSNLCLVPLFQNVVPDLILYLSLSLFRNLIRFPSDGLNFIPPSLSEGIEDKKAEGHRIRARIPKFEETEPNITYYAKLEKSKSEKNLIYSLYKKNGDISAGTSKEFYCDLYRRCRHNTAKQKFLNP